MGYRTLGGWIKRGIKSNLDCKNKRKKLQLYHLKKRKELRSHIGVVCSKCGSSLSLACEARHEVNPGANTVGTKTGTLANHHLLALLFHI